MRSVTENDLVFTRERIAEVLNAELRRATGGADCLTAAGVSWLHEFGRLPIVRIDRTYIANRKALEAAVQDGFRCSRARRSRAPRNEM